MATDVRWSSLPLCKTPVHHGQAPETVYYPEAAACRGCGQGAGVDEGLEGCESPERLPAW